MNYPSGIQYLPLHDGNHYMCMWWWTPLHKDKHCLILQHGTILLVLDNDLKRTNSKTHNYHNIVPHPHLNRKTTTIRGRWDHCKMWLECTLATWYERELCYFTAGCIQASNMTHLNYCIADCPSLEYLHIQFCGWDGLQLFHQLFLHEANTVWDTATCQWI